jgi:hypothetical protein
MTPNGSQPAHAQNSNASLITNSSLTNIHHNSSENDNNIYTTHNKNYTYGHDLQEKQTQHTRIIYTNINGITGFPSDHSIINLIDTMEEIETDILLLSKINIPWNNITTNTFGQYFKQKYI